MLLYYILNTCSFDSLKVKMFRNPGENCYLNRKGVWNLDAFVLASIVLSGVRNSYKSERSEDWGGGKRHRTDWQGTPGITGFIYTSFGQYQLAQWATCLP